MHRLDENVLINAALIRRFNAEADHDNTEMSAYHAFIQRSNGDFLSHQLGPAAEMHGQIFARDILTLLNKKLHHDGAWVVVFTHYQPPKNIEARGRYNRFVLLWMDKDGDVQFPIEHEGRVERAIEMGSVAWERHAETCWEMWQRAMRSVLDPQPNELFRRAMGEKQPSLH